MSEDVAARICRPVATLSGSVPFDACCLGTINGGGAGFFNQNSCPNPLSKHDQVANYTAQYLDQFTPGKVETVSVRKRKDIRGSQSSSRRGLFMRKKNSKSWEQITIPHQECDVCRIVDYLIMYNWTLSLQGDSVTAQSWLGLECELLRRGYNVTASPVQAYPDQPELEDEKYIVGGFMTMTVSWPSAPLTATIQNFAARRAPQDMDRIYRIVQSTDIFVFDHGLHYMPSQGAVFESDVKQLLQNVALAQRSPGPEHSTPGNESLVSVEDADREVKAQRPHSLKLVAWRQTTAQHYNEPGGHYRPEIDFSSACVPIDLATDEDFRLPLMETASEKAGYTILDALDPSFQSLPRQDRNELVVLPFRQYTSGLHYLHPGECTHFCNDPHVWLPIWRSLRIALDRTVRQYSDEIRGHSRE
jgi:hypothetical protein